MARKSQNVQVGKRTIQLSNLDKILYPNDGLLKAEIIRYYLQLAPTILRHIKGRPLSLIRYPEGIDEEKFFQKNKPQWSPAWIESVKLGSSEEKKDYIMATEEATLVWLANLACLELHQMHFHKPHYQQPDYFVIDLDPPEEYDFHKIVEIALLVKNALENHGYIPFVKTSGGKGLHVYAPVEPEYHSDEVFEAARQIAQKLADNHPKLLTLHIKKEARKGRVLLDIYRNRSSQTIIAAYSLRGLPGAPVSMPVTWEEVTGLTHSQHFTMNNTLEKVMARGDAWETIHACAVPLHTRAASKVLKKALPESAHFKSPVQLAEYQRKRNAAKTPEPMDSAPNTTGKAYVVHRHHASRLHYDLRLEQDGVLRSWAVPKGLPPRPGIRRLIVQTEDHPLEYLTFAGSIPKSEYGGGEMWVFNTGKYDIVKQKKNGFYFNLYSRQFTGEFRMHHTGKQEWLLERVDAPQADWLNVFWPPMLAEAVSNVPLGEAYLYELKWDGIRAIITLDEGSVTIRSRNGKDITTQFPELTVPEKAFRSVSAVFDGEIVCPDENGKPSFSKVITRLKQSGSQNIGQQAKANPAVCYLFDCLYLDGMPLMHEPLWQRREWLLDSVKKDAPYRVSEVMEDGEEFLRATKSWGLEGIMAKDKNSTYQPGKRTGAWKKIKNRETADCLIAGFTEGKGDREPFFGALQLVQEVDGQMIYRGKVGTGFNRQQMKKLHHVFTKFVIDRKPFPIKMEDEKLTCWMLPTLVCEIAYASLTENQTFREPVFVRLREDMGKQT